MPDMGAEREMTVSKSIQAQNLLEDNGDVYRRFPKLCGKVVAELDMDGTVFQLAGYRQIRLDKWRRRHLMVKKATVFYKFYWMEKGVQRLCPRGVMATVPRNCVKGKGFRQCRKCWFFKWIPPQIGICQGLPTGFGEEEGDRERTNNAREGGREYSVVNERL